VITAIDMPGRYPVIVVCGVLKSPCASNQTTPQTVWSKPAEYTLAGIAASSQHQGKSADLSDLPDNGGERLADGQGCVPAVAKRLFAIDALQSYTDTLAATTFSAPA
jgi:hypothetical protein